jgi:Cd2+/Zn2+-exporting ATPase
MGAAGTDVALETADIALTGDDLTRPPFTMRLSRGTLAIIKQNIWFSIAVKGIFLVLALVGWTTLWMAVASDMGASLLVIINGCARSKWVISQDVATCPVEGITSDDNST